MVLSASPSSCVCQHVHCPITFTPLFFFFCAAKNKKAQLVIPVHTPATALGGGLYGVREALC